MAPPPRPSLSNALVVLCEDAFFALTAARKIDADRAPRARPAESGRRGGARAGRARGGLMGSWETWVTTLCAAIAPIAPPRWMPMADAVELGLLAGARSARGAVALHEQAQREGSDARAHHRIAAVRVLGAVISAAGSFSPESAARAAAVASLGLPRDDQRMLNGEKPILAENLDAYSDVEPKIARYIDRARSRRPWRRPRSRARRTPSSSCRASSASRSRP